MGMYLEYHWNTGSIPPPDYYEYTITIGPGPHGTIRFRPDYADSKPPEWIEPIKIDNTSMDKLLQRAQKTASAGGSSGTFVGGPQERLSLVYGDQEFRRLSLDQQDGRQLAEAVKDSVSEDTWKRLYDKFEAYRNKRR